MGLKDDITQGILTNYKHQYLTTNYEIYSYFKKFSIPKLTLHYAITGDSLAKRYFSKLKDTKVLTTGDILLKVGFKQGEQIGIILEKLLEEKLNNNSFAKAADELIWIKNNF